MDRKLLYDLENEFSKAICISLASRIKNDANQIEALCQIICDDIQIVSARAAWVFQELVKMKSEPVQYHFSQLTKHLTKSKIAGVKRNILAVFQTQKFSDELLGELVDICFQLLNSSSETVAVKVYSMQIIANACKNYPELSQELITSIEAEINRSSIFYHARAKKIMKAIAPKN